MLPKHQNNSGIFVCGIRRVNGMKINQGTDPVCGEVSEMDRAWSFAIKISTECGMEENENLRQQIQNKHQVKQHLLKNEIYC